MIGDGVTVFRFNKNNGLEGARQCRWGSIFNQHSHCRLSIEGIDGGEAAIFPKDDLPGGRQILIKTTADQLMLAMLKKRSHTRVSTGTGKGSRRTLQNVAPGVAPGLFYAVRSRLRKCHKQLN
jgi:hypothetical protein